LELIFLGISTHRGGCDNWWVMPKALFENARSKAATGMPRHAPPTTDSQDRPASVAWKHCSISGKGQARHHGTKLAGPEIRVISQGAIIGAKLEDYLRRHPEIETRLPKKRPSIYLTIESSERTRSLACLFHESLIVLGSITLGGN
jgi:hypothetical protein